MSCNPAVQQVITPELAHRYRKIAATVYKRLRQDVSGRDQPNFTRQLALIGARANALYVLIGDLMDKGCANETRILLRPLIEDCITTWWVCASKSEGPERLFSVLFFGRLAAYWAIHGRMKLKDVPSAPWWPDLVKDMQRTADALNVRFAKSRDLKDVIEAPRRSEIYKLAGSQVDLGALETAYVDCCSAVHRDGHDLNRYWLPEPQGRGEVLVDKPYNQPEKNQGEVRVRDFLASTVFISTINAIANGIGVKI